MRHTAIPNINARMAKKRVGGHHKTPRKAVQIPVTWIALARKLAVKHKQPMMWYIVSLLGEAGIKEGLELPKFPWEEETVIEPPNKKK